MDNLYKLSEHVYILPYNADTDRPNLGYILSDNEALLFDAGCGPKTVNFLQKELSANHFPQPREIILSHYHWDHTFAVGYIDKKLLGTSYTNMKLSQIMSMSLTSTDDLIVEDDILPEFCREHLKMEYSDVAQIKLRNIDRITDEITELKVGNINITLQPVVSPHSEGQLIAYVKEDKVLFIGDADSGYIRGMNFIDDKQKRQQFYDTILNYDFDCIILSHFEPMTKDEFWKMASEELAE